LKSTFITEPRHVPGPNRHQSGNRSLLDSTRSSPEAPRNCSRRGGATNDATSENRLPSFVPHVDVLSASPDAPRSSQHRLMPKAESETRRNRSLDAALPPTLTTTTCPWSGTSAGTKAWIVVSLDTVNVA